MPNFVKNVFGQFKDFWAGLEKTQRNKIIATTVITAAAIVLIISLLVRPEYTVLISGADRKEVGEMVAILQENNIWCTLKNDGTEIIINKKDNDRAQVLLAQSGYPKGGMTFEDAISMIGITTTESDKKHIWRQQQTSDIERKLMMLDVIDDASVSLALPEESVFLTSEKDKSKPTAIVRIKPTTKLTPEQVKGIVMIVSRSVENLSPENVTVVDNNSNILNSEENNSILGDINTQEEIRLARAQELEQRVYKYFDVGGFNNFDTIRVVANPYIDFDRKESTNKLLSIPEGMDSGAIISEQKRTEELENGSPGDIPGTDTNPGTVPEYQTVDNQNSSYSSTELVRNYEYNETLVEEVKATGVMRPDLSTMAISLWYGKRVTDESLLTDEFLEQVKLAASTATGIPVSNITVFKYKLAPAEETVITTSEKVNEYFSKYGLFIVLVLLILGILITLRPRRADKHETVDAMALLEQIAAEPKTIEEITADESSEIRKQIDDFVKKNPEAVAQLLRNWLAEDWDN